LSYIAGVFAVTTTFGLCTVVGLGILSDLTHFEITPAVRYRGQLLLGLVLIGLAYFPLVAQTSAPGWALTAMRQRPWVLGLVGLAVGMGQAPTAIPYLTGTPASARPHALRPDIGTDTVPRRRSRPRNRRPDTSQRSLVKCSCARNPTSRDNSAKPRRRWQARGRPMRLPDSKHAFALYRWSRTKSPM
jgi:hypothetical protein